MLATDAITKAVAARACTGCGACAALAPAHIEMVDVPHGGLRPRVAKGSKARRAANAVAFACAGLQTDRRALATADGLDERWGPVLAVWEGYAADCEIRYRGSSGGAVTALALHTLTAGLAGAVSHVAASPSDPTVNTARLSTDRTGLMSGSGSRYAPADACATLGAIAEGASRVTFVGKPCDVASAKRAAAMTPALKRYLGITIAIFCAGAPSSEGTRRLLDRLGKPAGARLIDLTYRGRGWPGPMRASWQSEGGDRVSSRPATYAQGWGEVLQSTRPWRCRICTDHSGAFADISVGDPWHNPPTDGTDHGRSLIVARTAAGAALIEDAIRAGALVAERRERAVLDRAQPNLVDAHASAFGRRMAMRVAFLHVPRDKGFAGFALWRRHLSARRKVQSIIGTFRRIVVRRLWAPDTVEALSR